MALWSQPRSALEFRADKKGEALAVTNKSTEMFGMNDNNRMKLRTLDELVEREFVLPYMKPGARRSPRVKLNPKLQR